MARCIASKVMELESMLPGRVICAAFQHSFSIGCRPSKSKLGSLTVTEEEAARCLRSKLVITSVWMGWVRLLRASNKKLPSVTYLSKRYSSFCGILVTSSI